MKDIIAPAGYRLADVIGGDEIDVRETGLQGNTFLLPAWF